MEELSCIFLRLWRSKEEKRRAGRESMDAVVVIAGSTMFLFLRRILMGMKILIEFGLVEVSEVHVLLIGQIAECSAIELQLPHVVGIATRDHTLFTVPTPVLPRK